MPISNEVIELVPASKSKSKLIIFIVAAAVSLALAVTFLVLYLVKPNVEEAPLIVNQVTIAENDLFSVNENGSAVNYAAVGQTYTIKADISTENGASKAIDWVVSPSSAVNEIEKSAGKDGELAYFTFKPNEDQHGKEITISAVSQYVSPTDGAKSAEIKFTIVNQGAESIKLLKYAVNGDSTTATDVPSSGELAMPIYTVSMPGVSGAQQNTYVMTFEQLGKYNPSTDTYLPVTSIGTGADMSNLITVESSGSAVTITDVSTERSFFAFKLNDVGESVITITANTNNPSEPVTAQVKIMVKSTSMLGYVDSIYVFNKPIINATFIDGILNNAKNGIDMTKLDAAVKADKTLVMNKTLTLPYNTEYSDIFDHVLVSPISIQYEDGKIKDKWYENMTVTSSVPNTMSANRSTDKGYVLNTKNVLTSTAADAAKCSLTFTDSKPGSRHTSQSINVNIIGKNTSGESVVNSGSKDFAATETAPAPTTPGAKSTFKVKYAITMPGLENDALTSVLEFEYLTRSFMLEYDTDYVSVSLKGSDKAIAPGERQVLPINAMTLVKTGGTTSSSNYTGTVEFDVTTKSDVKDGDKFGVKFIKLGTFAPDDSDWENTVYYQVNKVATKAYFVENGKNIATAGGEYAGDFAVDNSNDKLANIYIQAQTNGVKLLDHFKLDQLVDADGACDKTVTFGDVLQDYLSTGNDPTFKGECNNGAAPVATATITVKQSGANNTVGVFKVNIYLIDAITTFGEIDSQSVTYAADHSARIELDPNDVKVKRVLEGDFKTYKTDVKQMELSYGTDSVTGKFKYFGKQEIADGSVIFKHGNTPVYELKKSIGAGSLLELKPLTDIYEYSKNNNENFGRVSVHYILKSGNTDLSKNDYYTGNIAPIGVASCVFIRKADDIAVFTDSSYSDESRLNIGADAVNAPINQGDSIHIFVSSVIKLNDGDVITRKVSYADNEESYILIDSTYNPHDAKPVPNSADRYYSAVFTAPTVNNTVTGEDEHNFSLYTPSSVEKKLKLVVQNKARVITGIQICKEDKTTPLTAKDLMFGNYIGFDNGVYTKKVYINVTYKAHSSSDLYFESAVLELPSFLTATFGSSVSAAGKLVLTPSIDVADENFSGVYTQQYECVLTLKTDAAEASGDLLVRNSSPDDKGVYNNVKVGASVGTGLGGMTVTVGNGQPIQFADNKAEYTHPFALANDTDEKSVEFTFAFGSMTGGYNNIAYNLDDITIQYNAVSGLLFDNGIKANGKATLKVDLTKLKTMSDAVFTVTFTDKAGGASANNVYTFTVKVTVTMDIFDIVFADDCVLKLEPTGESSGEQNTQVKLTYNNGKAEIQPEASVKATLGLFTYDAATQKYTQYTGTDFRIDGDMLYVKNSVTEYDGSVYVGVSYKDLPVVNDKHFKQIAIDSKSHHIEINTADSNITVTESDGKNTAAVTVAPDAKTFKLPVNVVNDGTKQPVTDSDKKATYGVYSSNTYGENDKIKDGSVTIDNGGNITINPNKVTDTVYYRASYTDDGGTGKTYNIDVAITYYVAVSGVSINGNVLTDNNIVLYYAGSNGYTTLDLNNYIDVVNAFAGVPFNREPIVTVTTNNADLEVTGKVLTPKASGTYTVTVTAEYGASEKEKTYTVKVVNVDEFSLNSASGTLNIAKNNSLTIEPTFTTPDNMTASFTVTGDSKINKVASGNNYTLTANRDASSKGSYTLTATLVYTPNGKGLSGGITFTKPYNVTVENSYTPEFKLYCGTQELEKDSTYAIQSGATYKLVVTNTADYNGAAATLSVTATNGVITFGTFSGNEVTFDFNANASGATKITVEVNLFGELFKTPQNYTFTRGLEADAMLTFDGAADEFTASEQYADYEGAAYKSFRYTVSDVKGISASDIYVFVNGTKQAVIGGSGTYYVDIAANYVGKLSVYGYVKVGGVTVYLKDYSVELKAHAPDFVLNVDNETLTPTQTAEFSVANNETNFKGTTGTVTYSIVSGTDFADINGNILTAKHNLVTGGTVIVKAVFKVVGGIYNDIEYTLTKEITVNGAPLPTISFDVDDSCELPVSGEKTFTHTLTEGFTASYSYDIVSGEEYVKSLTDNKITIKDDATAGGKVLLKVTATVTSAIHNGAQLEDTVAIIVTPVINTTVVTIGNAAQSIDLAGNIIVNARNSGSGVVLDADTFTKYVDFKTASDSNDFAINGTVLTLKNNLAITEDRTVNLIATVVYTSGAYNGKAVTCDMKVTVEKFAALADFAPDWSSASGAYATVDANDGISDATSINVACDNKYVVIANNGTAAPEITVDKFANVSLSASDNDQSITLYYTVVKSGRTYYVTRTLTVKPVVVTVIGSTEGADDVTEGFDKFLGDTFDVTLNAKTGTNDKVFNAVIDSISVSDDLTVNYAGNKAMFVVPSEISGDGSYSVTINYSVGAATSSVTFVVTVKKPQAGSDSIYTADNTEKTNVKVGNNSSLTSTWSYNSNAYSSYRYGSTLTIATADGSKLNKYFTNIEATFAYDSSWGSSGSGEINNLDYTSGSMQLNRYSKLTGITLTFTLNTSEAFDRSLVTATLKLYNRSNGGQSQDVTVRYYFKVSQNTYTVTFDANDGNIDGNYYPTGSITVINGGTYGMLPVPTREYYTFQGWYLDSTFSGSAITSDTTVDLTANAKLYAKWTPKNIDVILNANGGTLSGSYAQNKITVNVKGTYTLPTGSDITREGYTFDGWYTDAALTNKIETGATVKDNIHAVLYAKWEKVPVTPTVIKLDLNDGETPNIVAEFNVQPEGEFSVHLMINPTREGYTFLGWFDQKEGGNKLDAAFEIVEGETVIYAQWQKNEPTTPDQGSESGTETVTPEATAPDNKD